MVHQSRGKLELCPVVHIQERERERERCCLFVSVSALSFSLHFSRLLTLVTLSATLAPSLSASRPFISPPIPTISISHFSRFCLLTFHLSAQQIPLQLPKLCQKTLSLFIYFFYSFSATSSLNGKCARWNRLIITFAETQELYFRHVTDAFIDNNLQSAGEKG